MGFEAYDVELGGVSRAEVEQACIENRVPYATLGLANPFVLYTHVIEWLTDDKRIDMRPLSRLMEPVPSGEIAVAIRHDIDVDICTAVAAAQHLSKRRVPGSFYLLHTSHYYGVFANGVFLRHRAITDFVADLAKTGCEIGLHNDALSVYHDHGRDGAAAVRTEISWLRSQGLNISGTVAHNSALQYGAENFEIFEGRALANRKSAYQDNKQAPLQVLSEEELNLSYEGNYPIVPAEIDEGALERYLKPVDADAVRSYDWLQTYLVENPVFSRAYDASLWLLADDAWAIAEHTAHSILQWPVPTNRALEFISNDANVGRRLVLVVHPIYVSADST